LVESLITETFDVNVNCWSYVRAVCKLFTYLKRQYYNMQLARRNKISNLLDTSMDASTICVKLWC